MTQMTRYLIAAIDHSLTFLACGLVLTTIVLGILANV
jgi:hypothetical protein